MLVPAGQQTGTLAASNTVVRMVCPVCHRNGTFDYVIAHDLLLAEQNACMGIRRCPNPECFACIFFVNQHGLLVASYPGEHIQFDTTDIPEDVRDSLAEAISCHANKCEVAAAIMVRKTIELICLERGAKGKNLWEKLNDLSTKIIIPAELLAGLQDVRLLGNDAAHIESEVFAQVGKEELEVAIEVAKEVLKATYQYKSLMARLGGLKKAASKVI